MLLRGKPTEIGAKIYNFGYPSCIQKTSLAIDVGSVPLQSHIYCNAMWPDPAFFVHIRSRTTDPILLLMAGMVQEEGSSSVTSSPLQFFSLMSLSPGLGSPYPWLREMKSEERGLCLIHLLVACANHVAAGSVENANISLEHISHLSSPDGDTMQRIAAYFTEALADRILKAGLAILEAMEGEKVVHIIDLHSYESAQWINLLQLLSARPEGPPHLRITGIYEQKEVLEQMAHRLNEEAEKLDIPFQFNPIVSRLENLDVQSLRVKTGEALAVSSVLQLHSLLTFDDEILRRNSPLVSKNINSGNLQGVFQMNSRTLGDFLEKDVSNVYSPSPDSTSSSPLSLATSQKVMNFLNALWGLSPKLMVVTEQESNHNGYSLIDRIIESLNYYAALFDCLESTVPRASMERQKVEKMLFGEEIKNIIACEGLERKERHEKLEKWIPRFEVAGFCRVPLSYHAMLQARRLLQSYGYDGYKIKEESGCLVICWHNLPLYSVSAWRFRRPPEPGENEEESIVKTRERLRWDQDDEICRGHILNGMSNTLFDAYHTVKTAKELWNQLERCYITEDATSKRFIVSKFFDYNMVDGRSVMEQFNEIKSILDRYSQHKLALDEFIVVTSIIDKLPPS
ncbi:hypothetical protein RJ639_013992 [Escallonia herrerae]|uniref:Scarecrow-like protein 3 n=1 Tax=Escallonia herrerae TaxID=1293975 RepID=A0AA88VGQ3_9ASTE|nr:hypothetical protein RJ639_013992 [Escallonia herrerae]